MSRQNQNTPLLGNQGQPQRQQDPKLQHIQSQVNTAQGVMKDNIHLAIERGEKMNDLDDKTVLLENESVRFKDKSIQVRRNSCMNYYKQIAIAVAVIIAVVVILIIIFH